MAEQATDHLQARLNRFSGLDAENDLEYLLSLLGSALGDTENFDTDRERAQWAVAQWCQELQYQPDLREYTTGLCVPVGTVPEDLAEARLREAQEADQ